MVGKLVLVALVAALAGSALAGSELLVEGAHFDFGAVPLGGTVAHQFRLVAAGDKTVKVTEIKTGCACIALLPNGLSDGGVVLEPEDTVAVTILWQMRLSTGKVSRQVLVLTDGSTEPLRVKLDATVMESPADSTVKVNCRPDRVTLGSSKNDRATEISVAFTNRTGKDLTVELVSEANPGLLLAIPDSIGAGVSVPGSIGVVPGFETKDFETSITLGFKHGNTEMYRRTIPVSQGNSSFRPIGTK